MARRRRGFGRAGFAHPPGHGVHHYHFRLFALNVPELDLPDDATATDVLDAAKSNAIAEADVVGTYSRS